MRFRIQLHKFSHKALIVRSPSFCLTAIVILWHIIVGIGIILSYGNHNNIRSIFTKIPFFYTSESRKILNLVIAGLHSKIFRCTKISGSIKKCNSTLRNIVKLCIKLSCCHPSVGIPAVRKLTVMHRVLLTDIINRL